jgi:hypothetical protein
VEVEDEELAGLDKDEITELVQDRFYEENQASICAQCSGWGHEYSLDIGDDWSISDIHDSNDELIYENEKR